MYFVLYPSPGNVLIAMAMSVLYPRLNRDPNTPRTMDFVTYHRNFGTSPSCLICLYWERWRQDSMVRLFGMSNGTLLTGPPKLALIVSICSGQSCSSWLCPSQMPLSVALVFLSGSAVSACELMLKHGPHALVRCGNFCCCYS